MATKRSRFGSVVQRRYVDSYRVANAVNSFGQAIKIGGCVLGVIIFLGVSDAIRSPGGGFLLGLIVAALFFVVGIIVAAQGQLLKATLDTAVHSSPFLTDDLRATIMSLRAGERDCAVPDDDEASGNAFSAPVAEDGVDSRSGATAETARDPTPFCYHCGGAVASDATTCPACAKQL